VSRGASRPHGGGHLGLTVLDRQAALRQRSKVSAIVWPVDSLPNKRIPPAKSVIGCNAR
jgi:hypothetical protein